MGIIGSTVGVLADGLANLGEKLINAFSKPQQAWDSFTSSLSEGYAFIKKQMIDRMEGSFAILTGKVQRGILKMRIAWNDFTGDSEEAEQLRGELDEVNKKIAEGTKKIEEANKAVIEGYKQVKKSITGVIDEITREGKIAGQIADQRAKADKVERKLIVERAKANRDRADLLEKAVDKEKFTTQQRIGFLKQAGELEEKITNKEIDAARLRLEAKQKENALGKSTKADLDEEANLKAKLIDLETQRLTKQKEVTSQIIALGNEEKAAKKAIEDEATAKQKEKTEKEKEAAKELLDLKNQIRDAEAVTEEERRLLEIEKTTEHYDKLIALAKAKGLATEALEKAKTNALNKISEQKSKNEINWEKLTSKEKTKIVQQGLSDLTSILGEESAAGKAAAIANATISTYQSATDSYKSLAGIPIIGPALGFAAAGAAIASGMATVKKITSVKTPNAGGGGGAAVGGISKGSSGSAPSIPPAFNVVGASDTNQLAEAIGGQSKEPVKAYVVANDVSTAQSMDRNIVEGASI